MPSKIKPSSRKIVCDLGEKRKSILINIAKNKGMTLTDFVRSTFYQIIEDTPEHMKVNRHTDDDEGVD